MKSLPKKAAAYCRFSSENQRDESIDAQLRAIHEYANRNNIIIVKEYIDKAKSATSDKRPEFQQMIADSSKNMWEAVIVHKLDRFSRNKLDNVMYKHKLKQNGIRLISVLENLDDSPESVMLESVLEGMAAYHSSNLSREVMKGLLENAYSCKHTGGIPPLGYDIDPSTMKYVINEDEAVIVRKIFELYNNGYGYKHIIHTLNLLGYKTKAGNPFGKNSIHDIIRNEKYAGIYTFNKMKSRSYNHTRNSHSIKNDEDIIRIPDGVPAIVTQSEYDKAKQRLISNKRNAGSYGAKENYLLSGLIYCGECGCKMVGNRKTETKHTYRCNKRDRTCSCSNSEISKKYVERFVLHELQEVVFDETNVDILMQKLRIHSSNVIKDNASTLARLNQHLLEVNQSIDNVVSAIQVGKASSTLIDKLTELEQEKEQLENEIGKIPTSTNILPMDKDNIVQLMQQLKEYINSNNIPECKRLIQTYVHKVTVTKTHIEAHFNVGFFMSVKHDKGGDVQLIEKSRIMIEYARSMFRG